MVRPPLNTSPTISNRQAGAQWEKTAEIFLCDHGLKIVARNFSSRFGEIDLIMEDENTLVFVEVKYRKNSHHGSGAEAITFYKQNKISLTASWYLVKNPYRAEQICRFDVVSINTCADEQGISWIKDAFYSTIG